MRWVFCNLFALILASPAAAADFDIPPPGPAANYDILRGSETIGPATFTRWSGFYAGGQIGLSNGNADFSNAARPGLAYVLRQTTLQNEFAVSQWQVLGTANISATSYGGFAGYNTQWQDLIIGIEANLAHAGLNLNAPSTPIGPLITGADSQGFTHTVRITATGSVTNLDFATLRARAGYVFGGFLPYGFIGPAFGLANVSVTSSLTDNECSSSTPPACGTVSFSNSFNRNSEVLYGFTVGGGVDVALTANIFLRAEFEFDQFNPPPGILLTIATGRVGAGFKF